MTNFVLNLPGNITSTAAYNFNYIKNYGLSSWASEVKKYWVNDFKAFGNKAWNFINRPSDQILDSVFNYLSSPKGFELSVNLAFSATMGSSFMKSLSGSGSTTFRMNTTATTTTGGTYDGIRSASKYLQEQGVPRAYRKQILHSFEIETISLKIADNATFGIRFYGGAASKKGRYLFPTFTNYTNRAGLALPANWNSMAGISQYQIAPGSTYIFGRTASQGGI